MPKRVPARFGLPFSGAQASENVAVVDLTAAVHGDSKRYGEMRSPHEAAC
jgi:hypothetical protein